MNAFTTESNEAQIVVYLQWVALKWMNEQSDQTFNMKLPQEWAPDDGALTSSFIRKKGWDQHWKSISAAVPLGCNTFTSNAFRTCVRRAHLIHCLCHGPPLNRFIIQETPMSMRCHFSTIGTSKNGEQTIEQCKWHFVCRWSEFFVLYCGSSK